MKRVLKSILFLGLGCFATLTFAQKQRLEVQINSSSDDAEERGTNGSTPGIMDLTSSDIELVNDGGDGDQFVGLRFTNIGIPQGSKIVSAYVQFTVDETDNLPGSVIFKVEDTDNSTTFTSTSFDISSRNVMSDSVVWSNIPQWVNAGDDGDDQKSPDLTTLIQSLINRSGWQSGNALNFILTGTGERTAEAYDGSSNQAAKLIVEYLPAVTTSISVSASGDDAENEVNSGAMDLTSTDLELTNDGTDIQLIGVRFDKVNVPQGSEILEAYVQFTVDEVDASGDVDVLLSFESTDDAASISTSLNDLAYRTYLSDSIIWNNIPGWNNINDAGADQRTPDLKGLVQQIVNRGNWESGNAMLMAMVDPAVLGVPGYSGNAAKRVAQSYDNSPSKAPRLVLKYIAPPVYQTGSFPIAKNASWKYNDMGTDLSSSNWTSIGYNDSTWEFGNGVLGYNNGNEETTLSFGSDANAKHPTYYLRHTFNVSNAAQYDSLIFDVLKDDGVVVYVNGTEAFRSNMPAGKIAYNTLATNVIGGSDETTYFRTKTANLLQDGINVIAVELHQSDVSSSDLSFDMEVGFTLPPLKPTTFPIAKETEWHYLDDGSDLLATNWTDTGFNDDFWAFGPGPLGYGDPMNTELSFGGDPNSKYITYYFRREIDIDLNTIPDSVEFGVRRDDGIIVYVNGTEIIRDNLPEGTIDYTTTAPNTISGGDETTYNTWVFKKSIFRQGVNTIAVQLHNRDLFSSDLGFDLYLDEAPEINGPALGCANGNDAHIGCFTSIAPTSQTEHLLLPTASHRFQLIYKQGDAYTIGGGNIPGNHDFTAYVGLNGSSTQGHLSVNHETSPGGVSIVDLHYVDSTQLWVVDSSQAVDFFNNDLVTTTRNCSGGITPWGTILTAEESTNNGDANNDGYTDVGWIVEIDPITAKVKEYGNGKQEKLWQVGRVSHENAVVLNDSVTLYTGEDGGSSAVFKFVADNKMDLSSGTLYALKMDGPMSGGEATTATGSWVQVPNSTPAECNNTRSLAAALGATNFSGVEDIEVHPLTGQMYFTSKGNGRTYRFTDNGTTISDFETFVGGMSYTLNTEQGIVTESWGGGNDNLTFDDKGNLWVLQDGGRNYIWVIPPTHTQKQPKVELFMSPPAGSEPTGLTFSPDHKFGFVSIQHPSSSNGEQQDATFENIRFNRSATVVFSRKEFLGAQPPRAGFTSDIRTVVAGNAVEFTDTSVNNPTSRTWVFNGGVPAISNKKNETVTYNGVGFYTVELSVENELGSDELIETQYIEVIDPAPVSQFMADKTLIEVDESINFTDLSTNNPDSWTWTFEGGTPANSDVKNPTVSYDTPGEYTVTLVAANRAGSGNEQSINKYIVVRKKASIQQERLNKGLKAYPNPTTGALNMEATLKGGENVKIEVYDLSGRHLGEVINEQAKNGLNTWNIDLNTVSSHSQTLMVKVTVDGVAVQKLVQLIK